MPTARKLGLLLTRRFDVLVALAGRFADPGTAQGLLARFGAISQRTQICYWSVTGQARLPLVTSATALSGSDAGQRRPDFVPAELTAGSTVLRPERQPLLGRGGLLRVAQVWSVSRATVYCQRRHDASHPRRRPGPGPIIRAREVQFRTLERARGTFTPTDSIGKALTARYPVEQVVAAAERALTAWQEEVD